MSLVSMQKWHRTHPFSTSAFGSAAAFMAEIFWADLAASYEILKTIFISAIKDDL